MSNFITLLVLLFYLISNKNIVGEYTNIFWASHSGEFVFDETALQKMFPHESFQNYETKIISIGGPPSTYKIFHIQSLLKYMYENVSIVLNLKGCLKMTSCDQDRIKLKMVTVLT